MGTMRKNEKVNKLGRVLPFERDGGFFYRKGLRFIDEDKYVEALPYFRRAIDHEPDNPNYLLDLAGTYTELEEYEKSNEILFYLTQIQKKVWPECYFGIGCNFLGLQELDKAEESFEKYLQAEPDGDYAEDAEDMLDQMDEQREYLDEQSMILHDPEMEETLAKGRAAMDSAQYESAVESFEKLMEKQPDSGFICNNLALAYYCLNRKEDAIRLSEKVMEKEPNNVHTMCNLAIFYHDVGNGKAQKRYEERIVSLRDPDPDAQHKIAVTMCELGLHEEAKNRFMQILMYRPYDKRLLHCLAAAYHNLQEYDRSRKYWERIASLDEDSSVAEFYLQFSAKCKSTGQHENVSYHYQVPYVEALRRIQLMNEYLMQGENALSPLWEKDPEFRKLVTWGLGLSDRVMKRVLLHLLGFFHDERAHRMLRGYLLRKEEPDDIKKEVFGILRSIQAKEPYVAYLTGQLVEARVAVVRDNQRNKALEMLFASIQGEPSEEELAQMADIWQKLIQTGMDFTGKATAWAAALEYIWLKKMGKRVVKQVLCKRYDISPNTLNRYLKLAEGLLLEDHTDENH